MRHIVILYNKRRIYRILWDSDVPCPWNLREVLFDMNQKEMRK